MKKVMLGVAFATFVFTSCSEANKDNATTAQTENQEGAHTIAEMPAAGKVVVETPDYTAAGEAVKPQVEQILTSYLQLKEELTADDAPSAQAQAQSILEAANQVKTTALSAEQQKYTAEKLADIKESAGRIAGATDIKAQRANLELLSEATFALTKAFGATSQKLFYQHCPMANDNQGGYWLSATQEIRNPYFGKEMLSCGSNEEVLN
jgi:hypothetical protein